MPDSAGLRACTAYVGQNLIEAGIAENRADSDRKTIQRTLCALRTRRGLFWRERLDRSARRRSHERLPGC